jgi:AcrR family transcriptional regulator
MNERTGNGTAGGTAEALIAAGRRLFARDGYDGASVRAITAEAGANLGAITYHFGSKRELYDRVLASLVTPLAGRVQAMAAGPGTALERAGAVVRTVFGYLADNPDMPRLMMQELVLGGVPSPALGEPMGRVHGALQQLIREGQERGEVRSGDPAVLGVFIMSVPLHLTVVQVPLRHFAGVGLTGEAREQAIGYAESFVRSGLSAAGEREP